MSNFFYVQKSVFFWVVTLLIAIEYTLVGAHTLLILLTVRIDEKSSQSIVKSYKSIEKPCTTRWNKKHDTPYTKSLQKFKFKTNCTQPYSTRKEKCYTIIYNYDCFRKNNITFFISAERSYLWPLKEDTELLYLSAVVYVAYGLWIHPLKYGSTVESTKQTDHTKQAMKVKLVE